MPPTSIASAGIHFDKSEGEMLTHLYGSAASRQSGAGGVEYPHTHMTGYTLHAGKSVPPPKSIREYLLMQTLLFAYRTTRSTKCGLSTFTFPICALNRNPTCEVVFRPQRTAGERFTPKRRRGHRHRPGGACEI
ncbi:hypothetical protein KCP73_06490 [Salmonella enterica subsp. enterica]|nr:hypothetical protein KCP73_06490 [Salmonella enterica subsp. enterica]